MGSRGSKSVIGGSYTQKFLEKYKMSSPSGDLNDKTYRNDWIDKGLQENRKFNGDKNSGGKVDTISNVHARAKALGVTVDNSLATAKMRNSKGKDISIVSNGIVPHANTIMNQMATAKKFSPYTFGNISYFYGQPNVVGQFRADKNAYMINLNSISIPRVQNMVKKSGMVAKTYEDYVTRQIGISTFSQARTRNSKQLKALKSTWESKHKSNMGSLSKRAQRASSTKSGFTESFAEAFTNLVQYKQGRTKTLHPFASDVEKFLKSIK